jgi:hypothetical protein
LLFLWAQTDRRLVHLKHCTSWLPRVVSRRSAVNKLPSDARDVWWWKIIDLTRFGANVCIMFLFNL